MTIGRSIARPIARSVAQSLTVSGGGAATSIISDAIGAWGFAPLKSPYAGNLFRVRRSSDSTESDAATAAAAVTFCGAGNGFATTAYDQTGNARNITQGTTTIQPRVVNGGVSDGAFVLDGADDHFTSATRLTTSQTKLTFAAWIKPVTGVLMVGSEYDTGSNQAGWAIYLNNLQINVAFSNGGVSNDLTWQASGTLTSGVWQHVALVYDAGTITVYVDGSAVAGTPTGSATSFFNTTACFLLGGYKIAGTVTFPFQGSIHSAWLYSVAKSASEVLAIKNSVTP